MLNFKMIDGNVYQDMGEGRRRLVLTTHDMESHTDQGMFVPSTVEQALNFMVKEQIEIPAYHMALVYSVVSRAQNRQFYTMDVGQALSIPGRPLISVFECLEISGGTFLFLDGERFISIQVEK